jgi:ATP/ADP translocase
MQVFKKSLLRFQPGEFKLFLIFGILLLGNSLARQIAGIVAISGFLSASGVNQMLLVLGIDYLIVLVVSAIQSLVVDRFDRKKFMAGICLVFMLVFACLRVLFLFDTPEWLSYALMYLVAEQQLIFFPLIFWVLANDLFSMSQAKRLFPAISSWSFVGKLLGIGIAAASPALFARVGLPLEEVLSLNALIYLLSYLLVVFGLKDQVIRKTAQAKETARETMSEGWDFVTNVPSFRYLVIAILALALCDTIVEFRFLVVSDATFPDQAAYQQFYSLYRLGATLLSFLMQTFFTSQIIARLNLKNVFFIFPIITLLGSIGMFVLPGLSVAVTAMIALKMVRETIDESSRKSFQALVPEERRGRVSTFMDSYVSAIGTIVACLVTGLIVLIGLATGRDLSLVYLGVAILGAAGAIWSIVKMRASYDSSLLNWRLKRRQRGVGGSVLDKLSF